MWELLPASNPPRDGVALSCRMRALRRILCDASRIRQLHERHAERLRHGVRQARRRLHYGVVLPLRPAALLRWRFRGGSVLRERHVLFLRARCGLVYKVTHSTCRAAQTQRTSEQPKAFLACVLQATNRHRNRQPPLGYRVSSFVHVVACSRRPPSVLPWLLRAFVNRPVRELR